MLTGDNIENTEPKADEPVETPAEEPKKAVGKGKKVIEVKQNAITPENLYKIKVEGLRGKFKTAWFNDHGESDVAVKQEVIDEIEQLYPAFKVEIVG